MYTTVKKLKAGDIIIIIDLADHIHRVVRVKTNQGVYNTKERYINYDDCFSEISGAIQMGHDRRVILIHSQEDMVQTFRDAYNKKEGPSLINTADYNKVLWSSKEIKDRICMLEKDVKKLKDATLDHASEIDNLNDAENDLRQEIRDYQKHVSDDLTTIAQALYVPWKD